MPPSFGVHGLMPSKYLSLLSPRLCSQGEEKKIPPSSPSPVILATGVSAKVYQICKVLVSDCRLSWAKGEKGKGSLVQKRDEQISLVLAGALQGSTKVPFQEAPDSFCNVLIQFEQL